ncbi:ParB/RepB/Spo0J family partition protein [Mameliella sp. CS4]|uniref:ParB/RepB/Spo0J family partition protein n=1 Tax=Mameliella sp. CS4 TaxID=2862329 RepID=UPI001C5F9777|nr:ParB/RepB/Spo0J family partition protein [Mameliella sp. CS4]MBW4984775.1 ParB/RepB/Spo0J family partition protein [Mameliella sp. CS4]
MGKILTTITELPVDEIKMGSRLRPVSAAGVEALKTSIRELGVIKDPIHVRKLKKGGKIVLLAGGHRLTAARELRDEGVEGYETIKVTCWSCTDDFAQLMEIDDNLAGAELSALDTAVFLARRKAVYERMHPEAKAQIGAGLVAKRWDTADTMSVVSFAAAVAQTMGVSDRHVRRLVRAGTVLDPRDIQLLRSAPKPVALADLMELSKISEVTERYDVVDLMSKGEAKSAADAVRQVKAARGEGPAPKDATDAAHTRLADAWTRANKAARRRFVEDFAEDLRALLDEIEGGA